MSTASFLRVKRSREVSSPPRENGCQLDNTQLTQWLQSPHAKRQRLMSMELDNSTPESGGESANAPHTAPHARSRSQQAAHLRQRRFELRRHSLGTAASVHDRAPAPASPSSLIDTNILASVQPSAPTTSSPPGTKVNGTMPSSSSSPSSASPSASTSATKGKGARRSMFGRDSVFGAPGRRTYDAITNGASDRTSNQQQERSQQPNATRPRFSAHPDAFAARTRFSFLQNKDQQQQQKQQQPQQRQQRQAQTRNETITPSSAGGEPSVRRRRLAGESEEQDENATDEQQHLGVGRRVALEELESIVHFVHKRARQNLSEDVPCISLADLRTFVLHVVNKAVGAVNVAHAEEKQVEMLDQYRTFTKFTEEYLQMNNNGGSGSGLHGDRADTESDSDDMSYFS